MVKKWLFTCLSFSWEEDVYGVCGQDIGWEKETSNKTCFKKVSWRLSIPGSAQNVMAYGRMPCLFSRRTGRGRCLFAHKKWGCVKPWHNLTFYNLERRLFNIPCNIRLFCVSCDDDDNRSNDLHVHNLHSFCILHFCGNFCIPSSLYRIYTRGRYSLRNSILFSLFPFLFCPLVQTGSHSRLKKRGHKSIRFSS